MSDEVVGAALGILIAVISGFALLLLLGTLTPFIGQKLSARAALTAKRTAAVVTELLSIPTFWFGGPWLTGSLLHSVDLARAVPFYTIALAVCFCAIALLPLFKLILRVSNSIEGTPRGS